MIDNSFAAIESFLQAYGILAIFLLGFFEEIFFFIPSTVFFIAIGFFTIDPYLTFWPAFAVAFGELGLLVSLGIVVGGWIIYGLVYWGGKPFVVRFGKYIRVRWDDVERLNEWFKNRHIDEVALLTLRVVPLFPIGIVSIFCGLIRIRLWEFTWTAFVGSIPRVTALALTGWYLGKEYLKYTEQIAAAEHYILFGLIIIFGLFVLHLYRPRRS